MFSPAIVSVAQCFFRNGSIRHVVNHTFITLVPKRVGANRVEQFRPIALCIVIYKVISKVISTHLKHHLESLIHPS